MSTSDNKASVSLRASSQVAAFSGGKDSTAMILRLAELGESFSCLFTPTGNELPEVWEHIQATLSKVSRPLITPDNKSLSFWIDFHEALPNWRQRWCTRQIKIDPERAARSCHTGQYPCYREGCTKLTTPHRTLCPEHLAEHKAEERAKREREPWNDIPLWSETLEEFFDEPETARDRAIEDLSWGREDGSEPSEAEILETLEGYDLRLCVYRRPPMFDAIDFLSDWLPDDDHGRDDIGVASALEKEVGALNKAIEALPKVYEPTTTMLDLAKPYKSEAAS